MRGGSGLGGRRGRLIAKRDQVAQRGDSVLAQAPDLVELVDRLPGPSLDDRFRRRGADAGQVLERGQFRRIEVHLAVSVASRLGHGGLGLGCFRLRGFWRFGHRRANRDVRPDALDHPRGTPALARSSTLVYGRPAMIFLAVAGPTPGRSASSSSAVALFKSRDNLGGGLGLRSGLRRGGLGPCRDGQ